jgi:hypothetical protein
LVIAALVLDAAELADDAHRHHRLAGYAEHDVAVLAHRAWRGARRHQRVGLERELQPDLVGGHALRPRHDQDRGDLGVHRDAHVAHEVIAAEHRRGCCACFCHAACAAACKAAGATERTARARAARAAHRTAHTTGARERAARTTAREATRAAHAEHVVGVGLGRCDVAAARRDAATREQRNRERGELLGLWSTKHRCHADLLCRLPHAFTHRYRGTVPDKDRDAAVRAGKNSECIEDVD